jgi:tRNA dimethylallyltransferase
MKKAVFLVGPTASGKTEYAIALAELLDGQIISADSMQIYKYMDIGSAKPTLEERSRVKHYLVDEIDPSQPFSVVDYKALAMDYILQVFREGKLPIICGGTGLYINALLYDMDFSAAAGDIVKRDKMMREIGKGDPRRLHDHLRSLDPAAAEEIHPNNVKRVLRAIERLENGEGSLSHFAACISPTKAFFPILLGLTREREELYQRIDRRVDSLMDMGLVNEVQSLMERGFTENDIAMKGIGYKEIITCINEGKPPRTAAMDIKLHTRHYAKRQLTWFKRYEQIRWYKPSGDSFDQQLLREMVLYIKGLL